MERYSMDEIDTQIIAALDEDVRSSYRSLAKRIKVDQVTIRRRLKRLTESGVLRLGALVDYSKLGPSLNALFAFNVGPGNVDSVLQQVSELQHISWVSAVTGRFDVIALGRFSSHDELTEFVHKDLSSIKGLLRSETFVFLRRQKSFYSPFEKPSQSDFPIA
jgi:Lrp/AsnC family transcriptional regulator for asnA, asnC and gidA